MLSVHCPRHGQPVLLGHRQIRGIDGRGDDLTVCWVCWCGYEGRHLVRPRRTSLAA
ncbi:MAG TPA: hypothetical protein VIL48_05025 [Acidimicrobiales bacterium]